MTTTKTLKTLFDDVRSAGEIPYSVLDEMLQRSHALDRELTRILKGVAQLPIVDDRYASRILDNDEATGLRHDSPIERYVAKSRFLSAQEEMRLAKRIEFTRRRLEHTLAVADAPADVKELYYNLIETEDLQRKDRPADGRRPREADIQDRWQEYLQLRNDLIVANLPLVERIAGRYRTYGIPSGDLVQHGNLGLIRAADKFDWRRNVRFRTYAEWWIRQAIERATDTDRDVIHVPRPMRQLISKANHLHRRAGAEQPLDARRFAELMNVERGAAARAFSIKSGVVSLDRAGLEEGRPMKDDLIGPDLGDRGEAEELEHLRRRLGGMIGGLPEREQRVINLRYGLAGESPHTLEEVGEILNISRERVRQLQMRALDHLRVIAPDPRVSLS